MLHFSYPDVLSMTQRYNIFLYMQAQSKNIFTFFQRKTAGLRKETRRRLTAIDPL